MALSNDILGLQSATYDTRLRWQEAALYALGVGATAQDLDLVYEAHPLRLLPTMIVVPAEPAMRDVLMASGADLTQMVHHSQQVSVSGPLPAGALYRARCEVKGVYDLRRFAMLELHTHIALAETPDVQLAHSVTNLVFLGGGGFGGSTPPRTEKAPQPAADAPATWAFEQRTSNEQAALYRLSGDNNPLHIDPVFAAKLGFERGPILHGLATYGFAARHLEKLSSKRVLSIDAQFKKPFWPGETLRTEAWDLGAGLCSYRVLSAERAEVVAAGNATLG